MISLKPGDCYIFKLNGKMIIHRLVEKSRKTITLLEIAIVLKVTREQIYGHLYGNPNNKMEKQLIMIINWLYLHFMRRSHLSVLGLRKESFEPY